LIGFSNEADYQNNPATTGVFIGSFENSSGGCYWERNI